MVSSALTNSIGAQLVSCMIGYLMMGVVLTMGVRYFTSYPTDRPLLKIVVTVSLLLSLADAILDGIWSYRWLVTNYANPTVLALTPNESIAETFLLAAIPFVAQSFFAWRLWKITRGLSHKLPWVLPVVITALSAAQMGVVIWGVVLWSHTPLLDDVNVIFPTGYAWLIFCATSDILISVGMTYYLVLLPRQKAVDFQPHSALAAIALRAVETNTVTLVFQIVLLALLASQVGGLWFLIFDKLVTKAYCFSIIVSLNSRQSGQGLGTHSDSHPGLSGGLRTGGVKITTIQDVVVTDGLEHEGTQRGNPVNIQLNRMNNSYGGNGGNVSGVDAKGGGGWGGPEALTFAV